MNVTLLPQIQVELALLAELESLLQDGEAQANFVEAAVRAEVNRRRLRKEFDARAQAASEEYERTGISVPVETVVAKLQAKVDAKVSALRRSAAKPDTA